MTQIGFIGLGIMGKPMAKNLLKAGYGLAVYDVAESAVQEVAKCGARAADSIADAVKDAQVVITMLPNSPHVKTVMLSEEGVLAHAKEGTIVVDMSSISPIASKEVAQECTKKKIAFLDAPVSGGEPKAVEGTLAIMVGGDADAFEKVHDILLKMGSSAVLVGEV